MRAILPRSGDIFVTRRPPRQKRFERRANPSPIAVAADHRFFQLLNWLLKLRFMTSQQIARLLYKRGSRKYAERQLRAWYDNSYLERFPLPVVRHWGQTRAHFGAVRAIHCLGEAGARFLAGQLEVARRQLDWKPRDNRQPGNLEHTLALNNFLITCQLAARPNGWAFELLQSEREIDKRAGHDRVVDPKTGKRVTVRPDSVCRLVFPNSRGIYFSPEIDMGTEGPKKIKAKARAHVAHYSTGLYRKRHGVSSQRILFVVADVRDPLLDRPLRETEWRERVVQRTEKLKHWVEQEIKGTRRDLFWFVPATALNEATIYHEALWTRAGFEERQAPVARAEQFRPLEDVR